MTNDIKNQDLKYRPFVYVASAYSGDVITNIEKVKQYCRFSLEQGQIPLAPHLMFQLFMNDDNLAERELVIFMDVILLGKCDELWVFGDSISEGMVVEIEVAKKRRQPIRYFNSAMQEVTDHE